jgi:hypothetical protein
MVFSTSAAKSSKNRQNHILILKKLHKIQWMNTHQTLSTMQQMKKDDH